MSPHFKPRRRRETFVSEFCSEKEVISAGNGLFHNAIEPIQAAQRAAFGFTAGDGLSATEIRPPRIRGKAIE
ncbi:MAG: hypothetical protein WA728_26815 [Xanthobacteraceae bacterium]